MPESEVLDDPPFVIQISCRLLGCECFQFFSVWGFLWLVHCFPGWLTVVSGCGIYRLSFLDLIQTRNFCELALSLPTPPSFPFLLFVCGEFCVLHLLAAVGVRGDSLGVTFSLERQMCCPPECCIPAPTFSCS